MKDLIRQIFSIDTPQAFEKVCLDVFNHQFRNCAVYREYISHLRILPEKIKHTAQIPYLPVSFFKTHEIISNTDPIQLIFSSSGTTGMSQSKHQVTDLSIYEESFNLAFKQFYGDIENTCLLALLPSYQERDGSSLIYMVDALISKSQHPDSGYFLHNHNDLFEKLNALKLANQKTVLIGVTYALLDFADRYQIDFPNLIVMETGGMKGKRREMVRQELHQTLQNAFGVNSIHSEYGMTELLSQAYSFGKGIFNCPPWMKIQLRETNDPLSTVPAHKTGGINIIDLANINSCSFIATQDLGKVFPDGSFEVLGRFDNADIRGCNLLVN